MGQVHLTERQRQMLCLLTLANKQIAALLGLSVSGVKGNLNRLYRNLLGPDPRRRKGARVRALTRALEMGLVEMGDIVDGRRQTIPTEGQ